jgi:signal transduction histidine kinase/CheY-like chemotaxis protein
MSIQNINGMAAADLAILILAPSGKDTELACRILEGKGMKAIPCRSFLELTDRVADGCGPVVVAEEALDAGRANLLLHLLNEQPTWSDLPLVLFSGRTTSLWGKQLSQWRNITILPRPINFQTFFTVIQAAIESRRKQYLVRDLLVELHTVNDHLKSRTEQLQKFTFQLTRAEHQERRRIAGDIHDYLAQLLVVCRLKLSQACQYAERGELENLVEEIDQRLEELLTYTRTLVADLSPQVLYQAGLPEALKWLGRQMEKHGLNVQFQVEEQRITIWEDSALLIYQIVRELLFNVIKHAEVNTAVLSLRTDENHHVMITVADEGKGFETSSLEEKPGEFLKFGLFSIRERIEALQGQFRIQSTPGLGTKVTLMIPLQQEEGHQPVSAPDHEDGTLQQAATSSSSIRVVLVDDHAMVRQGLRSFLEQYPEIQVVGEAQDGEKAIELAHHVRPDVMIMDVNMPRLNGMMATRHITGEWPDIKVIGLSYDPSTTTVMMEAGALTQLDKAKAANELYQVICKAMGKG